MARMENDLSGYFINSDIDVAPTEWKQEGRDFSMLFLPLNVDDQPQQALQKINGKLGRIDFRLFENDNKLYFRDLTTNKYWQIDTSDLCQGQFHLVGQNSKATFVRVEIEDSVLRLDQH